MLSTQINNMLNTESQMGCLPEKQTTDHVFTLQLMNKHGKCTKTEEDICLNLEKASGSDWLS